jgi:hypothetical protein
MQNRPVVARNLRMATTLLLVLALGAAYTFLERRTWAQAQEAPRFEVDPFWPKALPNHWVLGQAIGVWVDAQDVVWIVHRGSATLADNEKGLELKNAECCAAAPPILAFDASGNLVRSWGGPGPGYDWPTGNHGIFVDHQGSVWIGGNGPGDSHVVKFTKDGKFMMQAGKPEARRGPATAQGQPTYVGNSHDQVSFGRIAKIFVDPRTNEAFLADGYLNKRVAVIDGASGKLKRYWGAYGEKPDDANLGPYVPNASPMRQFLNPVHCVMLSKGRPALRVRSQRRPDPGVQARWRLREGGVHRQRHEGVGVGVGRGLLARPAAALPLRHRRDEQPGAHLAARHARGTDDVRRWRASARPVLRRPQHRGGLEGQHLHH